MATVQPLEVPGSMLAGGAVRELTLGRGRHSFRWLDLQSPSEAQLDALQQQYDLHPLAMEDVRQFNQRAKLLDFGTYLFISIHALTRHDGEIHDQELESFLGPDFLITIHREPLPELDHALKRLQGEVKGQELGPDFFFYLIADEMTSALFPLLDQIDDEIDAVEDRTIENPTPQTLQKIFRLKQELIHMRRSLAPMRDVMNALASTRFGLVDSKTALYFRDAYDQLSRIYELIETARDLLGNALDAYLSAQSNRLNEIMKKLTLIATIFLPISFIVGWGGMNFELIPFREPVLFWVINLLLAAIPALMLIYFRRQKWF